jgi:hypothetical protein
MGWKYELTGDAALAEFPIPGTGELVRIEKGKAVELDQLVGDLPPGVKATEVKAKKGDKEPEEEGS